MEMERSYEGKRLGRKVFKVRAHYPVTWHSEQSVQERGKLLEESCVVYLTDKE